MSSEDESLPKEGPSMPEDAESMTADVVDATSGLDTMLAQAGDPAGWHKSTAKKSTGDPATSTPSPTAKKSTGDPATSTPSLTPFLRDDKDARITTSAGIISDTLDEENDKLETAAASQLRHTEQT